MEHLVPRVDIGNPHCILDTESYLGYATVANGDDMLDVQGLSKAYGSRQALDSVDLEVAAGEITALLGRNGAGKTTLVSIVAGLRSPDAGRVVIGGIDARAEPRRARATLGLAPQETGVYPTLSCRDNLRLFAGLAELGRREARAAIDELAESLGLTELLDRRAKELSGGERRRLHTAIALISRPALVLLDEPTVGADVQTRSQLLRVVRDLARDGAAVVYSTHYFPEVAELDASVAILERGRMLARGSIGAVIADHSVGTVELMFSGPAPDLARLAPNDSVSTSGPRVLIKTHDPATVSATILAGLGTHAVNLRDLKVSQPSLETAFRQLTEDPRPHRSEVVADVA
jgi:ABC-2 type transport system ATP-binding protein